MLDVLFEYNSVNKKKNARSPIRWKNIGFVLINRCTSQFTIIDKKLKINHKNIPANALVVSNVP